MMARSESTYNTYEESPDELKNVLERSGKPDGQAPDPQSSRDVLLQDHERHLRMQVNGVLPLRNFVLPLPYSPSKAVFSKMGHIHIEDIRINSRDPEKTILFHTITEPYVHSSSITIVEDEHGNVARLTLCNLEDSVADPLLPIGSFLAIKQPCWSILPTGGHHIRVDHPSDLVLLDTTEEVVPPAWRNTGISNVNKTTPEWRKEGDSMFLKKKFRKALRCYEHGRLNLVIGSDSNAKIDMHRKRCNVNIILLQFDAAAEDLAQAISTYAKSVPSLKDSELSDPTTIRTWLHSHSIDDPFEVASKLPRPLRELATRIKYDLGIYQRDPQYDFASISTYVGPLTLHIDAANYIEDTEIKQTSHHGRGLFAKRHFKAGDLIMAEKAFAFPGYLVNDRSSECSLYSLGDETATDRAGALLFRELVHKLDANPSLRRQFFDMDDGGYWSENGWDIPETDDIPVDVFRVEHIRRRNCFAAPLRAVDVLKNPSTPVRNGFWIHTSYINHSCLPNSVRTFLGDLLLLRATRNISAGEEINAQYITPDLTFDDRQQKYKGTWGFVCDCRLCEVDKKVGVDLDRQRMALFDEMKDSAQKLGNKPPTVTALKKLGKKVKELEALYSDDVYAHLPKLCLVHPTLFLTEAWRGLKNIDRMIDSAVKLLRYFGIKITVEDDKFNVIDNSGLVNVECVRALKYLAEGYTAKGQPEVASSITATAKIWFRIITGADVGSEAFLHL